MLINLTPHALTLRAMVDGQPVDTTIPPSGTVARVSVTPGVLLGRGSDAAKICDACPLYTAPTLGAAEGLPDPAIGVIYVVSGRVLDASVGRRDVFGPGTGPADGAVRDDGGRIIAVTRLVQAPMTRTVAGVNEERARIRAAVEALKSWPDDFDHEVLDRDKVLAAI
jgi:hypothetical protein